MGIETLVKQRRDDSAYEGRDDKHPHLRQSVGGAVVDSGGDSRRDATRGVDGSAGQVDADQVNEGQRKSDDHARPLAVFRLFIRDVENGVNSDKIDSIF